MFGALVSADATIVLLPPVSVTGASIQQVPRTVIIKQHKNISKREKTNIHVQVIDRLDI